MNKKQGEPKILIYDIETSPNLAYVWGKYDQDVVRFEEEWYILCFAYKWLGENKTHVIALPDFPKEYKKDPRNDFEVIKKLYELFDEADMIVAHNGNSFDQKKSNARFIFHGMTPPSPYKQIDTRNIARQNFKFNSNKLDDLGEYLKLGRKAPTGGFDLWLGCMSGKQASWNKMKKYNKQDVLLLEKIYLKLRPWMNSHPSITLITRQTDNCPKCGGGPMVKRGKYYSKVSGFQMWSCNNCGGFSRSRLADKEKTKVSFVN